MRPLGSTRTPARDARLSRRLHIWVPKTLVPLSTRRNRLKRLVREALRAMPELTLPGEGAYVLKVTRAPGEVGLAQTLAQVRRAVCRA